MKLKINSIAEKAIQVQVECEDYSVADILHKELLSTKHVKFAGVAPPHPLLKVLTMQIHTDGADANSILNEALTNAGKKLDELLSLAKQAFPDSIVKRDTVQYPSFQNGEQSKRSVPEPEDGPEIPAPAENETAPSQNNSV